MVVPTRSVCAKNRTTRSHIMLAIVSIREGAWSPSARSMPTVDFGGGASYYPDLPVWG
jgi:hypothetical protein